MESEDLPEGIADEEDEDDEAGSAPAPGGALRALGELLAAAVTVAAVLAALLIGAFLVQWIFR